MRVTPEEYERIDLRAHSLLVGVPLHDVWAVDLPGGSPGRTIVDVRGLLKLEKLGDTSSVIRFLFGLRSALGRVFGWDRKPSRASGDGFLQKVSPADRASSLVEPGTLEGSFRVLYVSPREAVSEIQNSTVHAFSVFALEEHPSGYRLYWAIYVRPVGRLTSLYMGLIDPFRRFIIYPAVLRYIGTAWARALCAPEQD